VPIGVCAFGYLALVSDWRYWVAVAGLLGGLLLMVKRGRQRYLERQLEVLKVLRATFAPSGLTVPHLKEGTSYGFATFTLTFPSEAELKQAEESGSIAAFKQAIQSLYADEGSTQNPFDANMAVTATYEGSKLQS